MPCADIMSLKAGAKHAPMYKTHKSLEECSRPHGATDTARAANGKSVELFEAM